MVKIVTILCENIRCKYCHHSSFFGYICYTNLITKINNSGKCITYKKDTPENIKLAKFNKPKL